MTRYFIRKTIVTWCLNLAIICLGLFLLPEIASEFIPAVEIPAVAIVFPTTVLSSDKIIRDLIEPVESSLFATNRVEHIETKVESGRSLLYVFYQWSLKPEECLQLSRQVVGAMQRPYGVLPPVFVLHQPTLAPILRVVLHGEPILTLTELGQKAASLLERTDGVSKITLDGATPRLTLITLDPGRMAKNRILTTDILSSAAELWAFRHLFRSPDKDPKHERFFLRSRLETDDDLRLMPVVNSQKRVVPLRWISDVSQTTEDPTVYFGKGESAVIFEVVKAPGADALSIVDSSLKVLDGIKKHHPLLKTTVIYDEAEKIRQAQWGVLSNFAGGILFNSLILIFFLGSVSGCVIASCIFPTAFFGTLIVIRTLGISFNIFSLNGFALAAGMITDSSTVILEAIMRRFRNNEELESACWKGTKDVGMGVFTGALASSAVMLPIIVQSGIFTKLFSDLAITIITMNFLCLIAVFSLVPWMASKMLHRKTTKSIAPVALAFKLSAAFVSKMSVLSVAMLERSISDWKTRIVLPTSVALLCIGSVFFLPPSELLPRVRSDIYAITIPIRRVLVETQGDALQLRMNEMLGNSSLIEWVITSRDPDTLRAMLKLKQNAPIRPALEELSTALHLPYKGILSFPLGPTPPTEPMNYDGYFYVDKKLPSQVRRQLTTKFCQSKGVIHCTDIDHYERPELTLTTMPIQMSRSGVTPPGAIMEGSLRLQRVDLNRLANLPASQPVMLKWPRHSLLLDDPFPSGSQKDSIVRFGSFFQTRSGGSPTTILRFDLNHYEPIYFRVGDITIGQAVSRMEEITGEMNLDPTRVPPMGVLESMKETFEKMATALTIAAILNFLILLNQFKSVVQTLLIMLSIPLAVGGATFGLALFGETLNAGVIVGFVLLVGIVVNNGIMLMEAINQEREQGNSLDDSIKHALRARVRPILMTACGTIFGMLPILLFKSEGSELYRGMAVVNIFGISFAAFLTLIVTPILTRNFLIPGALRKEH